MAIGESEKSATIRELESLRIARAAERKPSRLAPALVIIAVIAVLGAGGWAVYVRTLGRPPEVETTFVLVKGGGQPGVLLTGSGYVITRAKYITVGTKITGQIIDEPIEEGKHVKRGDLLAQIDDGDYKAQLEQAQADYQLAMADLKLHDAKAQRAHALFKDGYESADDLDVADDAEAVSEATVARTKAAIAFAQFNVRQCRIVSPIDGVVLQKYREMGATINFGGDIQAGGGTTDIAQLADTDDMRVEVDINESDIAKVRMGMPAQIVPDAYPNRTFEATVVKIYPEADRQKGTVKVEARFDHPDMKIIKPEMAAKVTFLAPGTGTAQESLVLIPKKAVAGAGTATPAAWVVRDGAAHRVPLVLGREFQDGLEVKQGLSGGETVIVAPSDALKDGQPVVPKAA